MPDQSKSQNAERADEQDQLRGGTQGGGSAPLTTVGGPSGGTNSISPTGASQRDRGPESPPGGAPPKSGGQFTNDRRDAEAALEGGSRHPSAAVAKQVGRDAADVDTTSGIPSAPSNPKQHDQTDPTGQSHSDGAFTTEGSLRKDGQPPEHKRG